MFTMIVLICVDNTCLNVLNIEGKHALEVIELGQKTLGNWKFFLSISGGDLKLDECSGTTQDYYWKDGQYLLKIILPINLKSY